MGLKIAITSTVSWPYVRRGSRITYELAVYLAKQGHEVHYISTKPGNVSRMKAQDGIDAEYYRLIEHPLLNVCRIQKFDTFSLSCLGALLKNDYDIVQTTFPMDAFAASIYRSIKGTPFVHYMFDRFYPRYYITPYGKLVFNRCIRTASRIGTISSFIRDDLKEKFGVEGVVIPGTVDTEQFTLCKDKDFSTPCILSTSSLQEPRKRVDLLVRAFERLLDHMPNAVLKLSGHTVPERTTTLLQSVSSRTRKSIEILGVGRREDLPSLYRNAAISVLPSVNEAFGLVILESLASGTPVVGTRSGGIPGILNDPKTGVLFEETDGPEELSKALIKGLELSRDPETRMRCRNHAEQYSWSRIGPLYEKLYSDVLNGRRPGKSGIVKKKMASKKIPASAESVGIHLNYRSNKKSLSCLFDDAIDELDIDYDNYYRIDLYKPYCTYVLGWLFDHGVRKGNVLVVGFFTRPLKALLEKCGFIVREAGIAQGDESLEDIPGTYDVITCDDIIQHCEHPGIILQVLRDKLNPGGKILLTTGNAANVSEVEKLITDAGFSISQSGYMMKEKAIAGSLFPPPVRLYFYKNLYYFAQRAFPRMRSHFFVAASRKSMSQV
ncbi:MAG: glycosyltransferase [Nitrospirae bacterium]|nr:glycosyltransferase [Nitrospirota bacterium]